MIPNKLTSLVEQKKGSIHRTMPDLVDKELDALGIPRDSELGQFFRSYVVTFFPSEVSDEELCDLISPTHQIAAGTNHVREVWELPEKYICLSTIQGEGAYLYDRDTGAVWDFDLASRKEFVTGKKKPGWASFFDFMMWYLGESDEL